MQPISIFLVDDSVADAELIKIVAQQSKMANQMVHFETGRSVLDHMRDPSNSPPDLILLDLNMPGMSGHEVLSEIRNDSKLRRTPVVILTSSEDETDIARGYDLHANAYVVKPVRIDGFQLIVDAIDNFWFSVVKLPPVPLG